MRPYKTWDTQDLKSNLLNQVKFYDLPPWVDMLLRESFDFRQWNPQKQFDGCTIVQDPDHPCIACWLHDFWWLTGRGGWLSNVLFQRILKLTDVNWYQRNKNFLGVTIGWYAGYKWKHLIKGNVSKPTQGMLYAKRYLK